MDPDAMSDAELIAAIHEGLAEMAKQLGEAAAELKDSTAGLEAVTSELEEAVFGKSRRPLKPRLALVRD